MIFALIVIMVLSISAANVLLSVNNKYGSIHQASNWQESLLAAEAAADLAMAHLREDLPIMQNDPQPATRGEGDALVVPLGPEDRPSMQARVFWDVPFTNPSNDQNYYRVRAEGIAEVTGPQRSMGDVRDNLLRRLSLVTDRETGNRLDRSAADIEERPKATRTVEMVVRPVGPFDNAITSRENIRMNNHNIEIVSFTSNTNAPDYGDANYQALQAADHDSKLQNHMGAHIATNDDLIEAGSANVYGDGLTNSGEITDGDNIHGEQRDDFYMDIPSIPGPTWTSIQPNPTTVGGSDTLQGGSQANPTRYKLDEIQLSGNNQLVLANPEDETESYIEIWVTGDISITGRGGVVMEPGVNVVLYFEGDANIAGNGFVNPDPNAARNLQLLGLEPPDGVTRDVTIAGNGHFVGSVYAPDHFLSMRGGGNDDSVVGAFVAKEVFMNGTTSVRYDRALADGGFIVDYRIASWLEDYRE